MLGYYKSGDQIDYVNAGSAISAGDVVSSGDLLGIAVNDIAASTGTGPVQVRGIVKVTKTGSQAWTLGQPIYYSGSNTFTSTATSNDFAGWAAAAVGSGASETTGYILLKGTCPMATLRIDGSGGTTDSSIIAGNDLVLASGDAASDTVKLQAYDVDATAYVDMITLTSHASAPTLGMAAPGAITIDGSSGTGDMTLTAGNDLTLKGGDAAADLVNIAVYDVDATAYVNVISAAGHATIPQLTIGNSAAGTAIGFHGKTPTTQQAHITDTTTNPTDITTAVNAILSRLETLGLIATA